MPPPLSRSSQQNGCCRGWFGIATYGGLFLTPDKEPVTAREQDTKKKSKARQGKEGVEMFTDVNLTPSQAESECPGVHPANRTIEANLFVTYQYRFGTAE